MPVQKVWKLIECTIYLHHFFFFCTVIIIIIIIILRCLYGSPWPSLSPHVSIVHRYREFFQATSCIGTDLLPIGAIWSSCLYSSMWRGPQEYVAYEFVLTSLAVSCMSGPFNSDCFPDMSLVAVSLLFCGVLPAAFVQYWRELLPR